MSIRLVPRADALAMHPTLAHVVLGLQRAHDPRTSGGLFLSGDRVWLDPGDEGATILDDAAAARLNDEIIAAHQSRCDPVAAPAVQFSFSGTLIFGARPDGSGSSASANAAGWVSLCENMRWGDTVVLGSFATPLLAHENDHPAMVAARIALYGMGIGPEFSGGIVADKDAIRDVLPHLFAIAQFLGGAPTIHLAAVRSLSLASLCPYGNFHLECYAPAEADNVAVALPASGLHPVGPEGCGDDAGALLAGRAFAVD